jgi:hypothetical protein
MLFELEAMLAKHHVASLDRGRTYESTHGNTHVVEALDFVAG